MQTVFENIIEKLEELHERYINQYGIVGGNPSALAVKECIDTVREIAEQYNNGWISCSERLPENISTVILQVKEIEKPTFGWYGNITGWKLTEEDFLKLKDFTVVAWQPLPQTYTKGEING